MTHKSCTQKERRDFPIMRSLYTGRE